MRKSTILLAQGDISRLIALLVDDTDVLMCDDCSLPMFYQVVARPRPPRGQERYRR